MDARLARTREALGAIRNPFDREILPDNKDGQVRCKQASTLSCASTVDRPCGELMRFSCPIFKGSVTERETILLAAPMLAPAAC